MSGIGNKIDFFEQFEHLPKAPIVEAVIHWRARSGKELEPDGFLRQLKEELPDYPNSQRQQEFGVGAEFGPGGSSIRQHHIWRGFRFESADRLNVAQFTRNGFVFSRLKPYEDWERFEPEAKRLWKLYCGLAAPSEIERLCVRFINMIIPVNFDQLNDLLTIPPQCPRGMHLPVRGFMHQNTFEIPGEPYNLNVIQTIQPGSPPQLEPFGLILDLEVFTTGPVEFDEVTNRLLQMQWIKNKAFFTFLKSEAIAQFRE